MSEQDEVFTEQFWTDPAKEDEGVLFEDPVYGYEFTLRHRKCRKATEYFRRRVSAYANVISGNRQAAAELAERVEAETLSKVLIVSWKPFNGPDGVIACPEDSEERAKVALAFCTDKRMRRMREYLDACVHDDAAFAYEAPRDKAGEEGLAAG